MDVTIVDEKQQYLLRTFGPYFRLPAGSFRLFRSLFSTTDGFVLSSSLAIAAGVQSTASFRSESGLLFLRRLRLDSAGVSMMLSNCALASEELGTSVAVLRMI